MSDLLWDDTYIASFTGWEVRPAKMTDPEEVGHHTNYDLLMTFQAKLLFVFADSAVFLLGILLCADRVGFSNHHRHQIQLDSAIETVQKHEWVALYIIDSPPNF